MFPTVVIIIITIVCVVCKVFFLNIILGFGSLTQLRLYLFTHSFYDEEERHVKCPNEDHTLHCIVNRPMLTGLNKNVIFEMFHQINKHQMKNFSFDFLLFYRITCTVGVLFLTWHHLHTTLLIPLSLSLSLL